ncbi:histone-like nucleoid-structuring protein Lsr2 [Nocardia sp. NBC_01327]|uniref:histone-like nucleoid-structuring protein Lsr2 n=1 Tax=Nocardia sp. NBC_01327 TaxID=2903593 RepID=UPI002E10ED00|nr:Lsr2 family protein [Nocardia sp. NBC_01327]
MARKVVVTLVDDSDGKSEAEQTVVFALDGVEYEMDLSGLNADRLRSELEQWTAHARKVGRAPRGKSDKARPAVDREQSAAIREWARRNGHEVSSRGRIQAGIVSAYHDASK